MFAAEMPPGGGAMTSGMPASKRHSSVVFGVSQGVSWCPWRQQDDVCLMVLQTGLHNSLAAVNVARYVYR